MWAGAMLVAFALLGYLVASGHLSRVDQYAVDHLMPGLYPYVVGHDGGFVIWGHSIVSNPNRIVNRVADAVTAPAAAVPASLLVAAALGIDVLVRRHVRTALVFGTGYALGNLAELMGKVLLVRPPLHVATSVAALPIWKFDASFPSGHAIRALLVVVILGLVWPPLRTLGFVWLAAVAALLELAGTHTPTDILGGLLLAGALALLCVEAARQTTRPGALRCR